MSSNYVNKRGERNAEKQSNERTREGEGERERGKRLVETDSPIIRAKHEESY